MRPRALKIGACLAVLLLPVALLADQWQVLRRADAREAAKHIEEAGYVLSFCSLCDGDRIEVWRVESCHRTVWEAADTQEELLVAGERLLVSDPAPDLSDPRELMFHTVPDSESRVLETVDLAYVYVPVGEGGAFRCLAMEMGLEASTEAEFIALPRAVRGLLGLQ